MTDVYVCVLYVLFVRLLLFIDVCETISDIKTKEKILEESSKASPNRSASPTKSKRTLATEVKYCTLKVKNVSVNCSKIFREL